MANVDSIVPNTETLPSVVRKASKEGIEHFLQMTDLGFPSSVAEKKQPSIALIPLRILVLSSQVVVTLCQPNY